MRKVPNELLQSSEDAQLVAWQAVVNAEPDYGKRVQLGKESFKASNTNRNPTFRSVRTRLKSMCPGPARCMYCENSTADEIDHVRPKDLFPEEVFFWTNYVFSCGACNGVKLAQWSIFLPTGVEKDLTRRTARSREQPTPPEVGDPLFIDPRREDPAPFLAIDLLGTFLVLPRRGLSPRDRRRAEYTIGVIGLSIREDLANARASNFDSYRARLKEFIQVRDSGEPRQVLQRHVSSLLMMDHPTVWFEMRRQHQHHPDLTQLFQQAPEALSW